MRRRPILVLAGTLAFAACQDSPIETQQPASPAFSTGAQAAEERVMPGELVVKLRSGVAEGDVERAYGVAVVGRGHSDAFIVLRGSVGNERALAARMRADERVVYAEPNYLREPHAIDSRLWAFDNNGGLSVTFTRGPNKGQVVSSYLSVGDADIDNIEGYASGGSPVVIGSIDTGVDFGHTEFLSAQLIAGRDWYSSDNDPSDTDGHGTHTTGTMVGRTVGVAGVAGAGENVRVYVQRVCGPLGCPTSAMASAIRAAADQPGMVAVNLSIGGPSESQAEKDAIQYAKGKNVLVIVSAGNDNTSTISCPACDPDAISVGALNWRDEQSYYTNWGNGLDLTAPGGELYSNTTSESGIYSSVPGGYAYYQGTSMAAPVVTGTAAIVASKSGLRGDGLRSRLETTTDNLGAAGYDTDFGHGRVNAYRAVTGNNLGGGGTPVTLSAAFTYKCSGSTCNFDGTTSTGATSWSWNFGDGQTADGATVSHSYAAGGYEVTLTVSDGTASSSATASISCAVRGKTVRCN